MQAEGGSPVQRTGQRIVNASNQHDDSKCLVRSLGFRCLDCAKSKARVSDLEDEVARLRGEMLALKAALRRTGMPLAPPMRAMR